MFLKTTISVIEYFDIYNFPYSLSISGYTKIDLTNEYLQQQLQNYQDSEDELSVEEMPIIVK